MWIQIWLRNPNAIALPDPDSIVDPDPKGKSINEKKRVEKQSERLFSALNLLICATY